MRLAEVSAPTAEHAGTPRSARSYLAVRRIIDLIISLLAFVFSLPVLAMACLAVLMESGGAPIYTQLRVGIGGKLFRIYKIRTMQAATENVSCVTLDNDPRVTRVGAFLRATKIDELPQLINIVLGDMSIIGPRPLSYQECNQIRRLGFSDATPGFIPIGAPGLIGLEQVNRYRKLGYADRFRLNALYEANPSWWLDLQIIIRAIVLCKVVVYSVMLGVIGELVIISSINAGAISWPGL